MKKIVISFITIIILIIGIIVIYPQEKKIIKNKEIKQESFISIMLETDDGVYKRLNQIKWPDREIYTMNASKSYCEQGTKIAWDKETGKINVNVKGTDKCYVYFDKIVGIVSNPYQINYIEDLVELAQNVNEEGKHYEGEYFVLTKDLDFTNEEDYENAQRTNYGDINGNRLIEPLITELTTGTGFKPIGYATSADVSKYFSGTFDGKNYTISNLYESNTLVEGIRLGLFGYIDNATIKNLGITGEIKTEINRGFLGSIAGIATGTTTIDSCISNTTITNSIGSNETGGIVASTRNDTKIINCTNNGTVSGGNNTGGIVGYNGGNLTIDNCVNKGTITNNIGANAGGLLGRDDATAISTTINDSHNEGKVVSNTADEKETHTGGLAGIIYKELEVKNCYNLGEIRNDRTTYTKNINLAIGGLIGLLYPNDATITSMIVNSYNKGNIYGATKSGGIIGYIISKSVAIINNCYNTGNISTTVKAGTNMTTPSGIIGYNSGSSSGNLIYVLNSYNTGNVTGPMVSSGIAYEAYAGKLYVLNSYNTGTINGSTGAGGLFVTGGETTNAIYSYNNYNIGSLKSSASKIYGVYLNRSNTTANAMKANVNTYYANSVSASNISAVKSTAMTLANMKNKTFVTTLNTNRDSLNKTGLSSIHSNLKGYTLRKWVLGPNEYPIVANEEIADLSGKGGIAESFGVKHDFEGITTSIDESQVGHIDLGLANQNFGTALTYVVRVRINEAIYGTIIGNHEASGATILYSPGLNKIYFSMYSQELGDYIKVYTPEGIEIGKWYTVIGTYDGSNRKIYLNGELMGSEPASEAIKQSSATILLGANPGGSSKNIDGDYLHATFSEALIFDRALTAEEIKTNYNAIPNPVDKSNLLAWYKFYE